MGDQPTLVTGATGNTGLALVDELTQRGAAVRVMVRSKGDAAKFDTARVPVVVADFDDAQSIYAALAGIGQAYLVTPSSEKAALGRVGYIAGNYLDPITAIAGQFVEEVCPTGGG